MMINITEYLGINLEAERWICRRCGHDLGDARGNYKEGLLVYDRDPTEIHKPLIDNQKYEYTFSPDPSWTALLEYYCPNCGTMMETEYTVPGHPPTRDIELDIDSLKIKAAQWAHDNGGDIPSPESLHRPRFKRKVHTHG